MLMLLSYSLNAGLEYFFTVTFRSVSSVLSLIDAPELHQLFMSCCFLTALTARFESVLCSFRNDFTLQWICWSASSLLQSARKVKKKNHFYSFSEVQMFLFWVQIFTEFKITFLPETSRLYASLVSNYIK